MFVLANIFQPLIDVFQTLIVFIHDHVVGGSWGFAIVGLTVFVRALLLPLTLKQVKSMQAMQRLAPEIKALQAKYKDDRQRQQQEMMKFYKENEVNPFGSCLPLAAQIPVFLSLFYLLRGNLKLDICGPQIKAAAAHFAASGKGSASHFIDTTGCEHVASGSAKFLFIPDITTHATGGVLIVLIALYVGSQLASSLLMTVTADRNQRLMMIGLPFLFTFFIIGFPAGLIVYWITTNAWTIGQQYVIRRLGATPPVAPTAEDKDGRGNGRARSLPPPAPTPAAAAVGAGGASAKASVSGSKRTGSAASKAAGSGSGRSGPPPAAPRKKKKRSGRRR